jgi:hypothetical protein
MQLYARHATITLLYILTQVAGVAKGLNGTVWVFHRGDRVWDAGTFGILNGEKVLYKTPIKEATILQLDQDTGDWPHPLIAYCSPMTSLIILFS